ncbi:MAG: hypothetical protein M9949_12600 [Candidatus Kapabacteria bacterium]|nr:hypothetical protein [Candidatus Kapabacteria bacterium]
MKKKYLFLIGVLFIVHSIAPKLYSQYEPPPCWMDCPLSIWQLETITMRLGDICPTTPPDCFNHNLVIQFWHRHAECPDPNPPYGQISEYDCQIKSISYHENCNNMCLDQLNIFGLYNIALKKVYNWMVGEYGINPLDTAVWRAVNVSCWGKLTVEGQVIIEYCPNFSENCCWKKYHVTQVNDVNVFTLVKAYIPEGAPPNCAHDTKPCYYYCDMI